MSSSNAFRPTLSRSLLMMSLSAAGFSAHADGFNFYALIDGGVASTSISGPRINSSRTEFVTGGYAPNFIGGTGEKSLGSGLKGGFQLEQGFLLTNNPTTTSNSRFFFGPDSIFNRQANVYVSGQYGTLRAGTQPNIAFGSVLLGDARRGSNYGSSLAAIAIDGGLGTVDSNAISYSSPSWNGLTSALSLVSSQRATPTSNVTSGTRAALKYSNSGFDGTFAAYSNSTKSTTTSPDLFGQVLGASYKISSFTLKGLYTRQRNSTTTTNKLNTTGFGGIYDLTSETSIDAGIFRSKQNLTSTTNYKMNTYGVGVQHKFLKDLTAYAQYASVKNNGTATAAFNFAGPTIEPGSITVGQSAKTLNVGVLYAFF